MLKNYWRLKMSNHTQNFEERKKNNDAEIYFEKFAKKQTNI